MRKLLSYITFVSVALSLGGISHGAIMSSEVRSKRMDAFRTVLSGNVIPIEVGLLEPASDPFVPGLGNDVELEEEITQATLTDEELLSALSRYINPTGIFMFGGEFYLVFKEKKLTVGSELPIRYDGEDYSVKIVAITGSAYKVRYGGSELQLKLK